MAEECSGARMSPCRVRHGDSRDRHSDQEWERIFREKFEDPEYYASGVRYSIQSTLMGTYRVMVGKKQGDE